jgi:signal transduction histidine kinase
MPHNPWVALEPAASLSYRARELRRNWEDYLSGGRLDGVRSPIGESWRRSQAAGFDPTASHAPTLVEHHDVEERWGAHPLAVAAPLILRWLGPFAGESDQLIVVSDADGMLLWEQGDIRVRSAAADAMNFVEGALWSEAGAGTNAIGTALAADHVVQVHAAEHLSEVVQGWTCAAVPVHDPVDGRLLGVIDLTGRADQAHPRSVAAVLGAARAVEAELRVQAQIRAARQSVRAPQGSDVPTRRRAVLPLSVTKPRVPRPAAPTDAGRTQVVFSRMAEEQAALRRVATQVAGQTTAEEIFGSVADEVARLFRADRGTVGRYDADGSLTVVAYSTREPRALPVGTRVRLDGDSVSARVEQSGRPSRIDDYQGLTGPVLEVTRSLGRPTRSTVGAPIVVEGEVWGVILASTTGPEPFPEDAESRLMGFAELVATAISNAVTRAELHASRMRLVTAADQARRRIERNLHDGAQQRLASLALELRAAAAEPTGDAGALRDDLSRAAEAVLAALEELREVSHGLHPRILSQGGLAPALRAMARRCALPVELEVEGTGRYAEPVEVAAYYAVSELLSNAVKHARATVVRIGIEEQSHRLCLTVRDDGVGGTDAAAGTGLVGVRDRVEALDGTLLLDSPPGRGTAALVSLPIG